MKLSFKFILVLLTILYATNTQAGDSSRNDNKTSDAERLAQFGKDFKNLPVKTAWVKDQAVIICETIEDIDISRFELQRSFNGVDFETIETVTAEFIAENTRSLAFIDYTNKNRNGKSFYRLKAVSVDEVEFFTSTGKTKKSGVFNKNHSYGIVAGIEKIK